MLELLSDFTIRTVALGAAVLGVSSGTLGCFALLRQQSLLGDMLGHAALPGVCLGFLLAGSRALLPLLLGALLSGTLAALFALLLVRRTRLKDDAALSIALSLFFALGLMLLSYLGRRSDAGQAGLEQFLFGEAAAIVPSDVGVIVTVATIVLMLVALMWPALKLVTFDRGFAASVGVPVVVLELFLTLLMAVTVMIGLQLVGVVLMATMLIAPAAAARQWSRTLGTMVALSALFGAVSGVLGTVVSATGGGYSTGPVIVLCLAALFLLSLLFAPERGLLWAALRTRQGRT